MKPFIAMSATKNGSRKRIRLSGNREDQVFRAFCSFRNAVIDDLEISVELEEIEFDVSVPPSSKLGQKSTILFLLSGTNRTVRKLHCINHRKLDKWNDKCFRLSYRHTAAR